MQIHRFVCCNPHDSTNHCGKIHRDLREAMLCEAEHQLTLDELDQVGWERTVVVGDVVALGGNVRLAIEPQVDLRALQLQVALRLDLLANAETFAEWQAEQREFAARLRKDLERNPPAPVRTRVAARLSSSTRKAA
jgi:hypothetical protein